MKKKNQFTLLLLLLTCSLFAQKTSLAVKAGWSGSNRIIAESPFSAESEVEFENRSALGGFTAGLEGRLLLGGRFSGTSGIQYTHKGFRGQVPMPDGSAGGSKEHLHYLNVPLAIGVRLFKGLTLQAGMEAGLLLAARTELPDRRFNTEAFFDIYREFDAGLLVGLEYQINKHFLLQVRGVQGLVSVFDGEFTDENGKPLPYNLYNRNIQLSAGYRF